MRKSFEGMGFEAMHSMDVIKDTQVTNSMRPPRPGRSLKRPQSAAPSRRHQPIRVDIQKCLTINWTESKDVKEEKEKRKEKEIRELLHRRQVNSKEKPKSKYLVRTTEFQFPKQERDMLHTMDIGRQFHQSSGSGQSHAMPTSPLRLPKPSSARFFKRSTYRPPSRSHLPSHSVSQTMMEFSMSSTSSTNTSEMIHTRQITSARASSHSRYKTGRPRSAK